MTFKLTLTYVRTFLPASLEHHAKACTEDKPMVKAKAGYTSQMKAKVQYPTLKNKKAAASPAKPAEDVDITIQNGTNYLTPLYLLTFD